MLMTIIPLPLGLALIVPSSAPIDAGIYFVTLVQPFYAALFLIATSLTLSLINPLSLIIAALALVGLIDYKRDFKEEEIRIEKVEGASFEELREIYLKMYGREGEEILKYEIEIRLARGMELEEALFDIKRSLSQA
jgi:hypothetical protein